MTPEEIAEAIRITEALLFRWEGLVLKPYLCSAGVPTIGLGSTRYLDGRPVLLTDPPISKEHALALAREQIRKVYMRAARGCCPDVTEPRKVAAMTSLVYNIGAGAFRASTLRRKINAADWDAVPAQWMRWDRAGGRQIRGLTARRAAELRVWQG